MPLKAIKMDRVFVYNGVTLPDPGPTMSPEQVRDVLALTYPEITTASLSGPEPSGSKLRYTFERAIGTKG